MSIMFFISKILVNAITFNNIETFTNIQEYKFMEITFKYLKILDCKKGFGLKKFRKVKFKFPKIRNCKSFGNLNFIKVGIHKFCQIQIRIF